MFYRLLDLEMFWFLEWGVGFGCERAVFPNGAVWYRVRFGVGQVLVRYEP